MPCAVAYNPISNIGILLCCFVFLQMEQINALSKAETKIMAPYL